ncbi:MAG: hypothetical protein ACI4T4_06165 [Limosilactobacillus sp.]
MNKTVKKTIVGTAALAVSLLLAACGQQNTASSPSSSSSSKVRSSENESTKAYRSANRLIRNHDYQGAYDKLNAVNNRSGQADKLSVDLENYLNAKSAYDNGNYDQAAGNLKDLKSTSPAMRDAYADLQNKITSAKKDTYSSSNSTTSTTKSSASSAITKNSSQSSTAANETVNSQTSDQVVTQFANKMGFVGSKGYEIIPTAKNGSVYRFEVRQNNQDNTVANMVGIYQYNSQSGAVTKLQ